MSHLGVQQIEADSVVNDIAVVGCVPVAAKRKRSLTNETRSCRLPIPEMFDFTILTRGKKGQKESEDVCERQTGRDECFILE